METALIRLQTLRVDTHRQLSEHFKVKVQLKEQTNDNEAKLHFCRGVVAALDEMEKILQEEMAPGSVEGRVPTSPGAHLDPKLFEGMAMERPALVKDRIDPDAGGGVPVEQNPEYGAQNYTHLTVQEGAQG